MPPRFLHPVHLTRQRLAPSLVLLLACALLWGQWLGQAHRVLHLPADAQAGHAHEARAHEAGAALDVLAHLLAPAEDAPDCRLYDQLGQGWATALPVPALPAAFSPRPQPWVVLSRHQPPAGAPFAARAPPQA